MRKRNVSVANEAAAPKHEIGDRSFLRAWLIEFDAEDRKSKELTASMSQEEKERLAIHLGFRTFRSSLECHDRIRTILQRFIESTAFHKLWDKLEECDRQSDGFSMSPANGGSPQHLLRAITEWYQLPRITDAERAGTLRKMDALASELLDLLGTISPAGDLDPFLSIAQLEDWQIDALHLGFGNKASYDENKSRAHYFEKPSWRARYVLKRSGVTPAFVLECLKATICRQREGGPNELRGPRPKSHAKGAMKTHFIKVVDHLLYQAAMFVEQPPSLEANLVAELVGLITDMDCSADDVYKVRQGKSRGPLEDFKRKPAESSNEKSE